MATRALGGLRPFLPSGMTNGGLPVECQSEQMDRSNSTSRLAVLLSLCSPRGLAPGPRGQACLCLISKRRGQEDDEADDEPKASDGPREATKVVARLGHSEGHLVEGLHGRSRDHVHGDGLGGHLWATTMR